MSVFSLFLFIEGHAYVVLAFEENPLSSSILSISKQENPKPSFDTIFFDNGTITKPQYMGIKMYIPPDKTWGISDCTTNFTLYHFPNPNNEITDADLSVIGPFKADGAPVGLWGQIITNDDAKSYPNYHLTDYRTTTIHDNPAVIIVYTMQNPTGIMTKNMKVIIERGDDTSKAWMMQYFTDSEEVYDTLLPTISNMVNSFELVSSGQFGDIVCAAHGKTD